MSKKSNCYILYQGHYSTRYILAVFTKKKDAVKTAREGGKYRYNKKQDLFIPKDSESEWRSVETEFLIHKPIKDITICDEIL